MPRERPADFAVEYYISSLPHNGKDHTETVELSAAQSHFRAGPPGVIKIEAFGPGLTPAELDALYALLKAHSFDQMRQKKRNEFMSPHYGSRVYTAHWNSRSCEISDSYDSELEERFQDDFRALFEPTFQAFQAAYKRGPQRGYVAPEDP